MQERRTYPTPSPSCITFFRPPYEQLRSPNSRALIKERVSLGDTTRLDTTVHMQPFHRELDPVGQDRVTWAKIVTNGTTVGLRIALSDGATMMDETTPAISSGNLASELTIQACRFNPHNLMKSLRTGAFGVRTRSKAAATLTVLDIRPLEEPKKGAHVTYLNIGDSGLLIWDPKRRQWERIQGHSPPFLLVPTKKGKITSNRRPKRGDIQLNEIVLPPGAIIIVATDTALNMIFAQLTRGGRGAPTRRPRNPHKFVEEVLRKTTGDDLTAVVIEIKRPNWFKRAVSRLIRVLKPNYTF